MGNRMFRPVGNHPMAASVRKATSPGREGSRRNGMLMSDRKHGSVKEQG